MNELSRELKAAVSQLMREENITQSELSRRLGVSRQRVSAVLAGPETISIKTAQRWLDKLGATLHITITVQSKGSEQLNHVKDS